MLALAHGAPRRIAGVCLALGIGALLTVRAAAERAPDAHAAERDDLAADATPLGDPHGDESDADETPPSRARFAAITSATDVATSVGHARVVPPRGAARPGDAPTITFLHGACMSSTETCSRLDDVTEDGAWLVCPAGNASCGGDASDWSGDGEEKAAFLDAAVGEARGAIDLPRASAARGDVLVGFSRGAFVARDVAYARRGQYRGLVLIGAATVPDAERLRESGIRRVVLSSGDYDGSRSTMVLALAKLCSEGIPTRWVSLGAVWHALPADSPKRLRDALRWVREDGDPGESACKRPPSVHVPGT
jgi:predicted esterase